MKVEYRSNNSGGSWWLSDKNWQALEDAGWTVEWGKRYVCHSQYEFQQAPVGKPQPCPDAKTCPGHQRHNSYEDAVAAGDDGRWFGALATRAYKECASLRDAIFDFETATGQSVSDEGCNCCGPPHFFSAGEGKDRQNVSGDEIVGVLYDNAPASLREAAERLSK